MIRLRANLDTAVERLLVLLMTAMVLCVLWQIVTRYLLGAASGWTGEAARFLMIWIGVLGGAYAVGQKIHLAMDLVKPKAGGTAARIQAWAIELAIVVFALLALVIGGTVLVKISLELGQKSSAMAIPIGVIYSVLPLSGVLMLYYCVDFMIRRTDQRPSKEAQGT
ncbi:MAG TPA: TRAP transporter small permease [Acidobacteriota bacterium]|nr:TRAP transporter small permease [Acidobacteriota bacterium]